MLRIQEIFRICCLRIQEILDDATSCIIEGVPLCVTRGILRYTENGVERGTLGPLKPARNDLLFSRPFFVPSIIEKNCT